MFDFSLTEIAVFGVVALLAIGPKDMPVAMRAAARTLKKARKMASEFQGHVDEMMREANLDEVRDNLDDIRNFDVRGRVSRLIDPDRTISNVVSDVNVSMRPETVIARPDDSDPVIVLPEEVVAPGEVVAPTIRPGDSEPLDWEVLAREAREALPVKETAVAAEAPAFVPPAFARGEAPAFIPPAAARRGI